MNDYEVPKMHCLYSVSNAAQHIHFEMLFRRQQCKKYNRTKDWKNPDDILNWDNEIQNNEK